VAVGELLLPRHAVAADADALHAGGGELGADVAEVARLAGAARRHRRGIEEQHDRAVVEQPGQRLGNAVLVGKFEVRDDVALAHPPTVSG
jgi:hypothetical protein